MWSRSCEEKVKERTLREDNANGGDSERRQIRSTNQARQAPLVPVPTAFSSVGSTARDDAGVPEAAAGASRRHEAKKHAGLWSERVVMDGYVDSPAARVTYFWLYPSETRRKEREEGAPCGQRQSTVIGAIFLPQPPPPR